MFIRIGGPHVGKATLGLVVNSDNVILDDIWSWRADHGVDGSFGWDVNPSDTGLVVNGDNVTATGLFVEHYKKYNVIWNGENGKTIFFQNEMPYDPPSQTAWRTGPVLGYAGYKVADSVKTHELWGGGSYIYTNVDPSIHATRAFEVPVTRRGEVAQSAHRPAAGRPDRPRHQQHRSGHATDRTRAELRCRFPGRRQLRHRRPTGAAAGTCTNPPSPTTSTEPDRTPTDHHPNPTHRPTPTTTTNPQSPTDDRPPPRPPPRARPPPPHRPPTTPPAGAAPTNLRATATSNSVTLTWSGDASATYDILRGEDGVKIGSVAGNTFTDIGLNLNTPYVYSVREPAGRRRRSPSYQAFHRPRQPPPAVRHTSHHHRTADDGTTGRRGAVQPAQDRPDLQLHHARLDRSGHRAATTSSAVRTESRSPPSPAPPSPTSGCCPALRTCTRCAVAVEPAHRSRSR